MTRQQKKVLDFLREYIIQSGGVSPSFQEIMDGVGLSSKSHVHRIVHALEERGQIGFMPNRRRAIYLLDNSDNFDFLIRTIGKLKLELQEARNQ